MAVKRECGENFPSYIDGLFRVPYNWESERAFKNRALVKGDISYDRTRKRIDTFYT